VDSLCQSNTHKGIKVGRGLHGPCRMAYVDSPGGLLANQSGVGTKFFSIVKIGKKRGDQRRERLRTKRLEKTCQKGK